MFFKKLLVGVLLVVAFMSVLSAKVVDCSERFAPIGMGNIVTFVPYVTDECRIESIMNKIEKFAQYESDVETPSVQDYKDLGISGVTSYNLQAINNLVAIGYPTDVDSIAKIKALVKRVIAKHYLIGTFDGVKGVSYKTSSGLSGVTGADGSYKYNSGDTVRFFIDGVDLGTVRGSKSIDSFSFNKPLLVSQTLHSLDTDADFTNGFDLSNIKNNLTKTVTRSGRIINFSIDNIDAYDKKYVDFLKKHKVKIFPGLESLTIDYLEKIKKKFDSSTITARPVPSAAKQAMYGTYKFGNTTNNDSINFDARYNYQDILKEYNYRLNVATADRLYIETIQKISNASNEAIDEIEIMKKKKEKFKANMELHRSNIFAVLKMENDNDPKVLLDLGSNYIKSEIDKADNERYKPEIKLAATILLDATRIKNGKDAANVGIDTFKNATDIFIRDKFSEEYPLGAEVAKGIRDIVLDNAKIGINCNAKALKKDPVGCADVVSSIFLDKSLELFTTAIQINAIDVDQEKINNTKVALELMMAKIYTKNDYCKMLEAYSSGSDGECSSKYGIIAILSLQEKEAEALVDAVVDSGDIDIYDGIFTDVDLEDVYSEYKKLAKRAYIIKARYNNVFKSLEIGDGNINDTITDRIVKLDVSRDIDLTQTFNSNSIDFKACYNLYSQKSIEIYEPEISLIDDTGAHKFSLESYKNIFRKDELVCGSLHYKPNKEYFTTAEINSFSSYPFLIEAGLKFRHVDRQTKNYTIKDRKLYNLSIQSTDDVSNDDKASVRVSYKINDSSQYTLTAFLKDKRNEAANVKKYIYNWILEFPGCDNKSFGDAVEDNFIKVVVPQKCVSDGAGAYKLVIYDEKNNIVVSKGGDLEVYNASPEKELSLSVPYKTIAQSGKLFQIKTTVSGGKPPYDITYESSDLIISKKEKTRQSYLRGYGNTDKEKLITVSVTVNDSDNNSMTKDTVVEISKKPSASINWASGYTTPFVPKSNKAIGLKIGEEITQIWGIINTSDIKLYGVTLKWNKSRSHTKLEHSKADIYVGDIASKTVATPYLRLKRVYKSLNIDEGYFEIYHRKDGKLIPLKFSNVNQVAYLNYKFYTEKDDTPLVLGKITGISPNAAIINQRKTFTINGVHLPNTIALSVQYCDKGSVTWLNSTSVRYSCIPRAIGSKLLYAKMESGGASLMGSSAYTVQILNPVDNKPTISITTSGSSSSNNPKTSNFTLSVSATDDKGLKKIAYGIQKSSGGSALKTGYKNVSGRTATASFTMDVNSLAVGSYKVTVGVSDTKGQISSGKTYYFQKKAPAVKPNKPILRYPNNKSTTLDSTPRLRWNSVSGADYYKLYVVRYEDKQKIYDNYKVYSTSKTSKTLTKGKHYVWGIKACNNNAGCSDMSSSFWFKLE
jgi:hypothetical protein